jgi:hypothetical protein
VRSPLALWRDLTRKRPAPFATISNMRGQGAGQHAVPMVTFTLEDRHVTWGDFDLAARAAEKAFAEADPASSPVVVARGVRIEAHPGFWTATPQERAFDGNLVVEAFKIAKRSA